MTQRPPELDAVPTPVTGHSGAVRAGGAGTPSAPVRTCVGCRGRELRAGLVRYVLVDGVLTPDPAKTMPGRGAWLHDTDACRALATKRRALERALRPR